MTRDKTAVQSTVQMQLCMKLENKRLSFMAVTESGLDNNWVILLSNMA